MCNVHCPGVAHAGFTADLDVYLLGPSKMFVSKRQGRLQPAHEWSVKAGYGSTFMSAFNGSGLLSYLGSGVLRNDAVVRDPQRIAIAMQQKSQNYASMLLPRTKHAATETSWTKNEATWFGRNGTKENPNLQPHAFRDWKKQGCITQYFAELRCCSANSGPTARSWNHAASIPIQTYSLSDV